MKGKGEFKLEIHSNTYILTTSFGYIQFPFSSLPFNRTKTDYTSS